MHYSIDNWFVDLLKDLIRDGAPVESRDGDVAHELIGYQGRLDPIAQRTLLMNDVRAMSPAYSAAEVLWYLGGDGAIKMLEAYAPNYRKYVGGDLAYGAYGPRLFWKIEDEPSLIMCAVQLLKAQWRSRQAVVTIWHAEDLWASMQGCKDIPCTTGFQFILRDDSLHMIVTMRSNDAWLGFPLDVFAFTCIQRLIATELETGIGTYVHNVGSMHLYARDLEKAQRAIKYRTWGAEANKSHGWNISDTLKSSLLAVETEKLLREGDCQDDENLTISHFNLLGHMMQDLVLACASKSNVSAFTELGKLRSEAFSALLNRESGRASAERGE